MKRFSSRVNSIFFPLLFCVLGCALPVAAKQHEHHHAKQEAGKLNVMVMNGYARATFPMAKTAAVYFTLHNHSQESVTLTSVDVPSSIAEQAQIHTTEMQGDLMKMRELKEGVVVEGGEMVTFESGGYHIMLLGLVKGLEEGDDVALTLAFGSQSSLNVVLPVQKGKTTSHHHH